MKKLMLTTMAALIAFSLLTIPVSATGPTGAGGSMEFIPFNPIAWDHALFGIGPEILGLGTATQFSEDSIDITVSAIPMAECDGELIDPYTCDGTWVGTHIFLKFSRAWDAATNDWAPYYTGEWTEQAWVKYYFWLNGAEGVTIERNGEFEDVTDFIYMKVQWVGDGLGNSDIFSGQCSPSPCFDVTIQAYK